MEKDNIFREDEAIGRQKERKDEKREGEWYKWQASTNHETTMATRPRHI